MCATTTFRMQELLAEIETLSAHVGDSRYTIVVTMSSLKMVYLAFSSSSRSLRQCCMHRQVSYGQRNLQWLVNHKGG